MRRRACPDEDEDVLSGDLEPAIDAFAVIRPLCDALLEVAGGRSASPRHEARFLSLLGFCLRPGFGATRDAARRTAARKIGLAELAFPRDVQCQAEWLVLWQRLAGGLTSGQQQDLYQRHAASLGLGGRARPGSCTRRSWSRRGPSSPG